MNEWQWKVYNSYPETFRDDRNGFSKTVDLYEMEPQGDEFVYEPFTCEVGSESTVLGTVVLYPHSPRFKRVLRRKLYTVLAQDKLMIDRVRYPMFLRKVEPIAQKEYPYNSTRERPASDGTSFLVLLFEKHKRNQIVAEI